MKQRSTGIILRPSVPDRKRDPRCKWCRYKRSEHDALGMRLLTPDERKDAFGPARNVNPHAFG